MRFYLRVIAYFRRDAHLIGLFLLLIAASIAIGVLQAWPMAVLCDVVLHTGAEQKPSFFERVFLFALPHNRLAQVIGVTILGMAMKFGQDSIMVLKVLVNNRFTFNGRFRVRCSLFAKLQDLSLDYHRKQPQGDAIYRVLTDSWGPDLILNVLINALTAAVTLVAMIAIMASRNVALTCFAMAVAPLLILSNHYFGKLIKTANIVQKVSDAKVSTLVQRAMNAVGLVQAFNRQRSEYTGFKNAAVASSAGSYELERYKAFATFAVQTIYTVGGAVIFGYGGYLVYRDQFLHPKLTGAFTVGDVLVFMNYLGSLWQPLDTLTSTKTNIQTGVVGAERVFAVLDAPVTIADPVGTPIVPADAPASELLPHLPLRSRDLSLENVSFAYNADHPVLKGITAHIAPGQLVAFVGPSGAGKSTLLQLIPRFYDVTGGSVQLDGIDVRQLPVADVRRHVALVTQESLLLPTTLKENIAYGRPDATDAEIAEAARLAGADDFIADLPDGLNTVVAEGGSNLSGGQRQRIAIARAILSEAPILVLDEPTSALDPANTQKVIQTLHQLRRRRTVVLVTHHLASVIGCDHVYVMQAGCIVEDGTHESLMKRNGVYAALYRTETAPPETATPARPRISVA